jgi:uncharacterized membrane protein (Fun14 family)
MPSLGEVVFGFSGTKIRMLVFAGVFVVVGLLINAGKWMHSPPSGPGVSPAESALRSDWTRNSKTYATAVHKSESWGDAAMRLGLSFIAALIVASLLRAFLKSMITFAIIAGGVLWFLGHRGIIDPFWEDYDVSFGQAKRWIVAQTNSIKALLKGYLPSAGAAVAGFIFGIRK